MTDNIRIEKLELKNDFVIKGKNTYLHLGKVLSMLICHGIIIRMINYDV